MPRVIRGVFCGHSCLVVVVVVVVIQTKSDVCLLMTFKRADSSFDREHQQALEIAMALYATDFRRLPSSLLRAPFFLFVDPQI